MQYSDRHPGGDSNNAEFGHGEFFHRQRFDDSHIFFCVCLMLARRRSFCIAYSSLQYQGGVILLRAMEQHYP